MAPVPASEMYAKPLTPSTTMSLRNEALCGATASGKV
jgi:hypothetical protein